MSEKTSVATSALEEAGAPHMQPKPLTRFLRNQVEYTTYCAKSLSSADWRSAALKEQVMRCRDSYRAYYGAGAPLGDADDAISAVYLTRVRYPVGDGTGGHFKRWFSFRFTPARASPELNADLRYYACCAPGQTAPVHQLLQQRGLLQEGGGGWMSLSRLCATSPTRMGKSVAGLGSHAAMAWLNLLHAGFGDLTPELSGTWRMTAQMSKMLLGDILRLPREAGTQLAFEPMARLLGVPEDSVVLDQRSGEVQSFRHGFPGYFLHMPDLARVVAELLREGHYDRAELQSFIDGDIDAWLRNPRVRCVGRLGRLITEASARGAEFRRRIDESVSDGPALWVIQRTTLVKQVNTAMQRLFG